MFLSANVRCPSFDCLRKYSKSNSYKGEVGETFENVVARDFEADGPWQKMGTDVTEFKQPWGKAYFAPIYDFGSKEIVAWSTSLSPNMAQQYDILSQLRSKIPEGAHPILHSDSKNVHSRIAAACWRPYPASRDRIAAS